MFVEIWRREREVGAEPCLSWNDEEVTGDFKKANNMPRVVDDQKEKFENDELFRKLRRESEVQYTGHRDRSLADRQLHFQTECREGVVSLAVIGSGVNFHLVCQTKAWSERSDDRQPTKDFVDFDRDPNKVYLKSQFIMNGVCVVWRGWIDLRRLDGVGHLEFDQERAAAEDSMRRQQQMKKYEIPPPQLFQSAGRHPSTLSSSPTFSEPANRLQVAVSSCNRPENSDSSIQSSDVTSGP